MANRPYMLGLLLDPLQGFTCWYLQAIYFDLKVYRYKWIWYNNLVILINGPPTKKTKWITGLALLEVAVVALLI